MAAKKSAASNGVQQTKKIGGKTHRRLGATFHPFWEPWKNKKQPKTIKGVVGNKRMMPKNKYGERNAFDVVGSDGRGWAVGVSATLNVAFAALGGGETVVLEYVGEGVKKKGQNAPHLVECWEET